MTFVILAAFAGIVGVLTERQVRSQFDSLLTTAATNLSGQLKGQLQLADGRLDCNLVFLHEFAASERAQIRIYDEADGRLLCTQARATTAKHRALKASKFGTIPSDSPGPPFNEIGYRVAVRPGLKAMPKGTELTVLYAEPLSNVDQTLARVQVFLVLGVLGGAVLALLAGLFVSDRAMSPIKELTSAAREIGRTQDASRHVPYPEAEDEIAELARTLEGMLRGLDASRARTQELLDRQREFVADASHELRTPLTSVLANLELLTEELAGEQAETAEAALRSTRRMRRLVGDLLLLARADAAREQPSRETDLGQVLVAAAAELGPMGDRHELSIHAEPAIVEGVSDDLHRLILNLLENACRHTPPGTRVAARTGTEQGRALLVVEDSGPGIAPELAARVFERFVRGGRDGGRGSGLGLAIVRSVAESHGGGVELAASSIGTPDAPGTRFVISLPLAHPGEDLLTAEDEATASSTADADQTSTTTGRTIGRRRNRS